MYEFNNLSMYTCYHEWQIFTKSRDRKIYKAKNIND